jgi:hypothetical protein
MRSDNPLKHFVLAFLLALIIYVIFYEGIEHRRARNGPWNVTFTNDPGSGPAMVINQPKLSITNVQISFAGERLSTAVASTNAGTLIFSQPRQVPYDVPLGKCIFMDTTFLPGTLTFQCFGHEIELLPRVLMIDHEEHPWRSSQSITVPRAKILPAGF